MMTKVMRNILQCYFVKNARPTLLNLYDERPSRQQKISVVLFRTVQLSQFRKVSSCLYQKYYLSQQISLHSTIQISVKVQFSLTQPILMYDVKLVFSFVFVYRYSPVFSNMLGSCPVFFPTVLMFYLFALQYTTTFFKGLFSGIRMEL